uniref:Uncharacterized protein n=1 Tax=Salvator merianae TaxID=96440 RepID=A0A8D0B482_SALMN
MATESCRNRLWAEAICPICLKYFTDPVSLVCGHNFCQACIALCWKRLAVDVTCLQCGGNGLPRDMMPNWQLAGFVRATKRLVAQALEELGKKICKKHQKPLRFFCEDDQASLCVVCDMSEAHGGHSMLPLEEFKDQIEGYLKVLRNTKDEVMAFTLSDGISQQLLVGGF